MTSAYRAVRSPFSQPSLLENSVVVSDKKIWDERTNGLAPC